MCIVGPLICSLCLIELLWYRFGQFSMSFLSNKSSFLPISLQTSHPLTPTRPLFPHFTPLFPPSPPPLSPYPRPCLPPHRNPLALVIFQGGDGIRTHDPIWIRSCIPKVGVGLSRRRLNKEYKGPFRDRSSAHYLSECKCNDPLPGNQKKYNLSPNIPPPFALTKNLEKVVKRQGLHV